jgi:hypothetical protein
MARTTSLMAAPCQPSDHSFCNFRLSGGLRPTPRLLLNAAALFLHSAISQSVHHETVSL